MIELTLPLPPSPNALPRHPMALVRMKNQYKRAAFFAACEQCAPRTNPASPVRIEWIMTCKRRRDEDNAWASLKWALDAIRQPRRKENFSWREGIARQKGWVVDDNEVHISHQTLIQLTGQATGLIARIVPVVSPTPE